MEQNLMRFDNCKPSQHCDCTIFRSVYQYCLGCSSREIHSSRWRDCCGRRYPQAAAAADLKAYLRLRLPATSRLPAIGMLERSQQRPVLEFLSEERRAWLPSQKVSDLSSSRVIRMKDAISSAVSICFRTPQCVQQQWRGILRMSIVSFAVFTEAQDNGADGIVIHLRSQHMHWWCCSAYCNHADI